MSLKKEVNPIWDKLHLYKDIRSGVIVGTMEQQPLNVSNDYTFKILDNEKDIQIITNFLIDNYHEGLSKYVHSFDLSYVKWLIQQTTCIALTRKRKSLMVGIICGKINDLQIHDKKMKVAEILFMCTHIKHRKKGISEILMSIMRQHYQDKGITCGIFGTSRMFGTSCVQLCYSIRPIDTIKLLKHGVVSVEIEDKKKENIKKIKQEIISYYDMDKILDSRFIDIEPKYYEQAYNILCEYLEKYMIHQIYTLDEFIKMYCNNECVKTLVVIEDEHVCDVISYCLRPFKNTTKSGGEMPTLKASQLLMYTSNVITPYTMIKNVLIHAKSKDCDMMVISNDTESDQLSTEIKGIKYANMNCYLINCNCPTILPIQISMNLLH